MNYTTYGNEIWYKARDNSEKTAVVLHSDAVEGFTKILDSAGVNFYGFNIEEKGISKLTVLKNDLDFVKQLVGSEVSEKLRISELKEYTPPEHNIFGTVSFKDIEEKAYLSCRSEPEKEAILKTAQMLSDNEIEFSGRVYPDRVTLTYEKDYEEDIVGIYNAILSRQMSARNAAENEVNARLTFHSPESVFEAEFLKTGFSKEQTEQLTSQPALKSLASLQVDEYEYISYLNSHYTCEQNIDLLQTLNDIAASGGFNIITPSEAEKQLYSKKKDYDLDVDIREFLSQHTFTEEQQNAIRDISKLEGGVPLRETIDETFTPTEIGHLYAMYKSEKPAEEKIHSINDFIKNHYNNLYEQDAPEPQHTPTLTYTDKGNSDNAKLKESVQNFSVGSVGSNKHTVKEREAAGAAEGKKTPADKLKELTERLEKGLQDLFESDRYKEYLNVMSKFHSYSLNNTILIAMQKPDASLIAGFNSWKNNFERTVKKGEKGIRIIAPSPYKVKKETEKIDPKTHKPIIGKDGKPVMQEVEITIPAFKAVSVFDISQTEGKELPNIAVDELSGSVDRYTEFFSALEKTSPVPISFEKVEGGSHGYYHLVDKRIAIKESMSELQTLKIAIHEISHAKLHDVNINTAGNGSKDKNTSRNSPDSTPEKRPDQRTREVEAESVAYVVCQHYGLDTSDYSFGYIAGWSSGKELTELKGSLEMVRSTAAEIIKSVDGYFAELNQDRDKMQQVSDGMVQHQMVSSNTSKEGKAFSFSRNSLKRNADYVKERSGSERGSERTQRIGKQQELG